MSGKIRIVSTTNVKNSTNDDTDSACKEPVYSIRVLIVDDDKTSGESLRDIIKYRGHKVTLLDEGMKFVNRMNEEEFDIIFMDYHTNDLESEKSTTHRSSKSDEEVTGTYVTRLAKECYGFDTPVYAYTGDNSQDAIDDFKASGFKGVFVKPVDNILMNSFFDVIEKEIEDTQTLESLTTCCKSRLKKIAMKNKNFIYFKN